MNNNQNIYLDKVVEFLVRDTKIYYDIDKIKFPFFSLPFSISSYFLPFINYRFLSPQFTSLFSKYCIDYYGLTDQEIKYIWIKYKTIIRYIIENNEQ